MPEHQDGNNPIGGSEKDPPITTGNKPDAYNRHHENNRTKLGIIARVAGEIGLATAATVGAVEGVRALTVNPAQPIKDTQNVLRVSEDMANRYGLINSQEDNKEEPAPTPTPTQIPQESTLEGAASTEPANLTELTMLYDNFYTELQKHPAAKIQTPTEGTEGYRVAIKDETIKLIKPTDRENSDRVLIIEDDESILKLTIKPDRIERVITNKNHSNENVNQESANDSIAEETLKRLQEAHNSWLGVEVENGKNQTSATQNIPEPSPTPSPTPKPSDAFSTPGPFDREAHEA